MNLRPQIPLHRLVLSLSEALDRVSPTVADHQLRVAYMSTRMARVLGYQGQELRDVFHAAALHDIGLVRAEDRVRLVASNELEGLAWHAEAGYRLLRNNEFFAGAAPLVRYHHTLWNRNRGGEADGDAVPPAAHILSLADTVDRRIRRDVPILHQSRSLRRGLEEGRGEAFAPECVEAFLEASRTPAFWLDVTSNRVYAILARVIDWPTVTIDETALGGIACVFGRVVDSLSPWTGTHSAGVAATAVALAERLHFSPREQALMRAAGYLHDLGKITVPSRILDKPGRPSEEEWAILKGHTYHTFRVLDTIGGLPLIREWAAFHHERLDGRGYPFGLGAEDLTLGARVMAVADVATAVAEDRPYRKGRTPAEAVRILKDLAAKGALDAGVVGVLEADFDAVDAVRRDEQTAYGAQQRQWAEAIDAPDVCLVTGG